MSDAEATTGPTNHCQHRQLASEATSPSSSFGEIQRDPDIWFEDGNIVVVAQQTAFRFHRGTLSRHSEIFRSLFSVPQPTSPETLDDCPVIRVTDTSYDFKFLLHAIYDGVSLFCTDSPIQFSVLASLVRMGHKYEVDAVLDESLRRLSTVYTTGFATWHQHQHKGTALVTLRREDAIEALNLFRLIGRSQMLPSAFYACARLEISELFAGFRRVDGTLETLSNEDLELVLEGRTELVKYDAQITGLFFNTPLPAALCTCRSPDWSRSTLATHFKSTITNFPTFLNADVLNTYLIDTAHTYQLCGNCEDALSEHHLSLKRTLWNKLPSVFGVQAADWGVNRV